MTAPTIPAAIRTRVAAGAAWLTEHRPGWLDRIDLITLDMTDPECCVIGQEYGAFEDSPFHRDLMRAAELGFTAESEARWDVAASAGLMPTYPGAEIDTEYRALDAAWRDLVLSAVLTKGRP